MRLKLLFIFILTLSLNSKDLKFESTMGWVEGRTLFSHLKDAKYILVDWIDNITKEHNGTLDVKFYKSSKKVYSELKNHRLDIANFNALFFIKNEKDISKIANNFWSLGKKGKKGIEYYLISRKNEKAKSFKGIKNKRLSVRKARESALIWLDKNSLIQNKKSYKKLVKTLKLKNKESAVVLDVFFGKSDYGIVSSSAWNTMLELNPTIKKRIQIVEKSGRIFLPFVSVFSKNSGDAVVKTFFEVGSNLGKFKDSKRIIDILNFDFFFKISKQELQTIRKYYKEYLQLQKRYN